MVPLTGPCGGHPSHTSWNYGKNQSARRSIAHPHSKPTHIPISLIKQRRRKRADNRHDQHRTRDTRTLRIKLHLLLPRRSTDHTHPRHQEHARKQAPDNRPLDEAAFTLGKHDPVENDFNDRAERSVDDGAHADAGLSGDGGDCHAEEVRQRDDAGEGHGEDEHPGGDEGQEGVDLFAVFLLAVSDREENEAVEDNKEDDGDQVNEEDVDSSNSVFVILHANRFVRTEKHGRRGCAGRRCNLTRSDNGGP
jgi:hypothetical protein